MSLSSLYGNVYEPTEFSIGQSVKHYSHKTETVFIYALGSTDLACHYIFKLRMGSLQKKIKIDATDPEISCVLFHSSSLSKSGTYITQNENGPPMFRWGRLM